MRFVTDNKGLNNIASLVGLLIDDFVSGCL